jgi:hypothetical protein
MEIVHILNGSYSGGRDEEDHSSRPYLENTQHKKKLVSRVTVRVPA